MNNIIFFLYKVLISPFLSLSTFGGCRFYPTCSEFSRISFEKYGPGKAFFLTIKRIASCHPFSKRNLIDFP